MAQKNLKTMYKKKITLENLLLKNGNKWKSENILKKTLKLTQKTKKNGDGMAMIKGSIVKNAVGLFLEHKQTLKKGKRKRVVKVPVVMVSERSWYIFSWRSLSKNAYLKGSAPFFSNLTKKIVEDSRIEGKEVIKESSILPHAVQSNRHRLKFKW